MLRRANLTRAVWTADGARFCSLPKLFGAPLDLTSQLGDEIHELSELGVALCHCNSGHDDGEHRQCPSSATSVGALSTEL